MTADWTKLPYEMLTKRKARIANEASGINYVAYASCSIRRQQSDSRESELLMRSGVSRIPILEEMTSKYDAAKGETVMISYDELKKHLPVVIEVTGLPRATAAGKRAVEKLSPGDTISFRIGEPSGYSRMNRGEVMLYLQVPGAEAAYLQPSLFRTGNSKPEIVELAEHLERLSFTVEELIPQSERTKRAKSPKLSVRIESK